MKYIKLDLLTLLISLFILSSCEKKGTIGLDIAPQDSIKSVFTEASTVNTITVLEDTTLTSGLTQNPFGFLKDPILGITEANVGLGLILPQDNLLFGTTPTLDSAVLVLKYGDEFYGDSLNTSYAINVHQLTEKYSFSQIFSTKQWGFNNTVIGSLSNIKKFAYNDSTTVNVLVKGKPDVATKVAPQIRIPISSAFINANFINGDPNNFKNNIAFTNFIKGLYLTINKSSLTGNGGIIFFNLQGSSISGLEIYYKNTTGTVKDTNVVVFKPTAGSSIKHDYTGTPVAAQLGSNLTSFSTVYVQPLAGVRTKLRFTDLDKLRQNGPVAVNKAELVIPIINGSDNPLKPAPRLTLYRNDIAGQRKAVPDNDFGSNDTRFLDERTFGGFYNSTTKTYTLNITSYIQDLINKPLVQYDTFIGPIDQSNRSNIFPSATTAVRSILGGKDHPQSRIKLRIIYTKPN